MKKLHFLEINLSMYRVFVVVTWGTTLKDIVSYGENGNIKTLTEGWKDHIQSMINDKRCNGFCIDFGDDNTDQLIWLRSNKNAQVLAHELFHAVDHISESHNLWKDRESRAYMYEYLFTQLAKYKDL